MSVKKFTMRDINEYFWAFINYLVHFLIHSFNALSTYIMIFQVDLKSNYGFNI